MHSITELDLEVEALLEENPVLGLLLLSLRFLSGCDCSAGYWLLVARKIK